MFDRTIKPLNKFDSREDALLGNALSSTPYLLYRIIPYG